MNLSETFQWQGRRVKWGSEGTGPPLVFCHGTPWSSTLWHPFADALSAEFSVYVWDMPGYGRSSMEGEHRVSLDVQDEVFADLLAHWGLERPHVVAHDYGGAVALRAHLLRRRDFASLALVDVVALAPWGTGVFRLVRDNPNVFAALPPAIHEGVVRAYIRGASHVGLDERQLQILVEPWLGAVGQAALYRQIAQADEAYTDEVQPLYGSIDVPTLIIWGTQDGWLPVQRAHELAAAIPGARLKLINHAGHLVQLDAPAALATSLHMWLTDQQS